MTEAVVVFGASGFVGRNLVDRLSAEGRTVYGVTGSGRPVPGTVVTVPLARVSEIPVLPEGTAVLHVANYRYDSSRFALVQSEILAANLTLNAAVFHFCAERKIRELRLASSVAVYPGALAVMDDSKPIDLNGPPHPGETFYAWSKRAAEVMAQLYAEGYGLNSICFRLSNPYGPFDSVDPSKAHVAPAFVMKALDANPIFPIRGDPAVERDFIYVGDVVEAFVRSLAWSGRTDAYNLCTGRTWTLGDLAETAMRVAGVSKRIEAGAPGAFGPARRISTNDRISADLGMTFLSLEQGLTPTIRWYRDEFRP